MQYAIKYKLYKRLSELITMAYLIAPSELESLICDAELIVKKNKEKKLKYERELKYGPQDLDQINEQDNEESPDKMGVLELMTG